MSYTSYSRGASKATPQTTCQKCLQKGHYSYECKATLQSRPYTSRPSRSQQLLNPRLRAQLSNAVPDPPPMTAESKVGLADAILAAKEKERRGRKRSFDEDEGGRGKRARSSGSEGSDSDSVSSISTGRSRSRSRERARSRSREREVKREPLERKGSGGVKRRRSASSNSSRSRSRDGGRDARHETGDGVRKGSGEERNIRHRHRRSSPGVRGRRGRSTSYDGDAAVFSQGVSERERSPIGRNGRTDVYERREGYGRNMDRAGGGGGEGGGSRRERSLSPYSRRVQLSRGTG